MFLSINILKIPILLPNERILTLFLCIQKKRLRLNAKYRSYLHYFVIFIWKSNTPMYIGMATIEIVLKIYNFTHFLL